MKKFVCSVCGYVYEGEAAPEKGLLRRRNRRRGYEEKNRERERERERERT